jgi:hypothetical protein
VEPPLDRSRHARPSGADRPDAPPPGDRRRRDEDQSARRRPGRSGRRQSRRVVHHERDVGLHRPRDRHPAHARHGRRSLDSGVDRRRLVAQSNPASDRPVDDPKKKAGQTSLDETRWGDGRRMPDDLNCRDEQRSGDDRQRKDDAVHLTHHLGGAVEWLRHELAHGHRNLDALRHCAAKTPGGPSGLRSTWHRRPDAQIQHPNHRAEVRGLQRTSETNPHLIERDHVLPGESRQIVGRRTVVPRTTGTVSRHHLPGGRPQVLV